MAFEKPMRPLATCIRSTRHDRIPLRLHRSFTSSYPNQLETQQQPPSNSPMPPPADAKPTKKRDPFTVASASAERALMRDQRLVPIGSRRRRAAMTSTSDIPFSQLPYQCFQEARSFLQEDRKEKLEGIRVQRERIERLKAKIDASGDGLEGEAKRKEENRLRSMRRELEELKILADINDPVVKRKFENGQRDMNKPIYRHLADQQWRSYKRQLLMQRITQMNVVPDVLPTIDPAVQTALYFPAGGSRNTKRIQHGDIVDSLVSEQAPTLYIQPYDKGTRLVTIAVVNPDVPDVEKDGFGYRCHFLATNIPISPTDTRVQFQTLDAASQIVLPWLPAWSQKGIDYQRMSVFVLQQPATSNSENAESQALDVGAIKEAGKYSTREGFNLRSFVDRFRLKPVGVDLFRTKWDESTAGVMRRAGVVRWDVEFKRKRVEPLPYQRKGGERYR